jgi:hypothetical protein
MDGGKWSTALRVKYSEEEEMAKEYPNDDRFVAMDREGDPPARDEVIVPGSWLRFVDSVESLALDFKRYVESNIALSEQTRATLQAQTKLADSMSRELES